MEFSILLEVLYPKYYAQFSNTLPSYQTLHAQLPNTQKYQLKLQNRDKMVYYSVAVFCEVSLHCWGLHFCLELSPTQICHLCRHYIQKTASKYGDNPHSIEGLLEAIFAKIKQKKSIFLPLSSAMTVPKQDLICNIVSKNFPSKSQPIPFIFIAIIKLIFSSKNIPLVCQNCMY